MGDRPTRERQAELWSGTSSAPEAAAGASAEERLQGLVERVTFHSEESLYTVLKITPERGYGDPHAPASILPERCTAVGRTPLPPEGVRVRLLGRWSQHREHGRQFEFDLCEPLPPADAAGLVKYLSSKAFPGIGETLASRIVERLGLEALETIRDHPERLSGLRGLSEKVRRSLVENVRRALGRHQAHAFLLGAGLGPWQAAAVVERLGEDCEALLREDPYRMATGIPGLGFATADRFARGLEIGPGDPRRLRAGLEHALKKASEEGHTLTLRGSLVERATKLLGEGAQEGALAEALDELVAAERVRRRPPADPEGSTAAERIYLPMLEACEAALAQNLAALARSGPVTSLATDERLTHAEAAAGLALHPLQRAAVVGLASEPLALLTGGPGVGKTTIVRLVVQVAEEAGLRVRLASPTGRAAKRLSEATGREAATVHRLLGWDAERRGFQHDARRPLEADLVVVDEISMLDVVLAHHLLKAVQPPTRLVFVGDPDQLPSVGPGNVISDLIRSEAIPVFRLSHIYRQSGESLIVSNAHRILEGEMPELPEAEGPLADFYFFPAEDERATADRLVEVVTKRIPDRFGLDWVNEVQVLAPMYRGECGVDRLNHRLREALAHGGMEARRGERVWREGDRVIQTRNDYDKEVFNGDLGRIVRVYPDGSGLVVRYPTENVFYASEDFSDLQPAFAITVHRSQGGEFPAVVLPLVTNHFLMLQRHLFYTAVTRAKKLLVLVGSTRAMRMAIDNAEQNARESALAERLQALLTNSPEASTNPDPR